MRKQLNPLQGLIDEMHRNKNLYSELAKKAEKEREPDDYMAYNKGVGYGLALEMTANYQTWQSAFFNPPKFDKNRAYPNRPDFLVVVKNSNGSIHTDVYGYNFEKEVWIVPKSFEVLYWQELPSLPISLLK